MGVPLTVIYRFLMLKFQFLEAISTAVDLGDAITSIKALFNSLGQKIKFRSWTSRTSRVLRTVTLESEGQCQEEFEKHSFRGRH